MFTSDVIKVATVIGKLWSEYAVAVEPHRNDMRVADYGVIADGIRDGWTSDAIVQAIAERNGWTPIRR